MLFYGLTNNSYEHSPRQDAQQRSAALGAARSRAARLHSRPEPRFQVWSRGDGSPSSLRGRGTHSPSSKASRLRPRSRSAVPRRRPGRIRDGSRRSPALSRLFPELLGPQPHRPLPAASNGGCGSRLHAVLSAKRRLRGTNGRDPQLPYPGCVPGSGLTRRRAPGTGWSSNRATNGEIRSQPERSHGIEV